MAASTASQLKRLFKLNNGRYLPMVGKGTYLITGQQEVTRVCDEALKAGYRLFDTAAFYENEIELGEAFKTLLPKYNLTRRDVYITSKLWIDDHGGGDRTENAAKQSIKKLQCDYLDLYLIHWPGVDGLSPSDPMNAESRQKTWSSLVRLYNEGILRSIGVSNYNVRHVRELVANCDGVKPSVNQVEWHVHNYQQDLLKECESHGILLQAYSPLGGSNTKAVLNDPTVNSVAKELNVTISQVLLRWALQHNVCVIPKAATTRHIQQNAQLDFVIPDDLMDKLDNIPIRCRYDWDPDTVA